LKKGIHNPEMSDAGKNWNVATGCDKYSDGCRNCYAEDIVKWLEGMGQKVYQDNGFNLKIHKGKLQWPLTHLTKNPRRPATQNSTEALLQGRRWEEFPESVIKNMDWD